MENHYLKLSNFIYLLVLFTIECSFAKNDYDSTHRLPSYFPQCYRNDPNRSKCILEATETVRPFLKRGVPELKIPSFEPFLIPKIAFKQGAKSFNIEAVLTDNLCYGLTEYKFSRFDFDVDYLRFSGEAHIENLKLIGNYNLSGQILFAKVQATGNYTATIKSGDIRTEQQCKLEMINGHEHLLPISSNNTINVTGPNGMVSGLFSDNPQLEEALVKALNDNIEEVFEELKPAVESVIGKIMDDVIIRSIAGKVPFDKLWPLKDYNK